LTFPAVTTRLLLQIVRYSSLLLEKKYPETKKFQILPEQNLRCYVRHRHISYTFILFSTLLVSSLPKLHTLCLDSVILNETIEVEAYFSLNFIFLLKIKQALNVVFLFFHSSEMWISLCLENVLSQVSLYECSHHSFCSTWHTIFVGIVVWFYFIRILVVGFSFLADSVLLMLWISVSAYEHLCYVSFSFL
jgi:hypothetical protein